MSDGRLPRAWRSAVILATLAAGAGPLAAQTAGQSAAAYRARIERLAPTWRAAVAEANRADSARNRTLPADTVRAGALTVIVSPTSAHLAADAAAIAWPMIERAIGDHARVLVERPLFLELQDQISGRVYFRESEKARQVVAPGKTDVADVAARLVAAASQAMASDLDPALRTWLGGPIEFESDPTRKYRSSYLELVTASSRAVQRCHLGELAWCREVLGLVSSAEPLTRWYDAGDRRVLVRELRDQLRQGSAIPTYDACVNRGRPPACDEILRSAPPGVIPPPLTRWTRQSLAQLVLQLGGTTAYGRLVRSRGRPVEAQLAAGAGIGSDSLLATWRSRILSTRPPVVNISPPAAWTALAWGTLFGLLALRSTRWR